MPLVLVGLITSSEKPASLASVDRLAVVATDTMSRSLGAKPETPDLTCGISLRGPVRDRQPIAPEATL